MPRGDRIARIGEGVADVLAAIPQRPASAEEIAEFIERRKACERRSFAVEAGIPQRIAELWHAGTWRPNEVTRRALAKVRAGKRLLLLCGRPGTGKSVAAASVLLEPAYEDQREGYRFVGSWVSADVYCQSTYEREERNRVRDWQGAFWLAIDDAGAESAHDRGKIERLISQRYDSDCKVTIITTNLSPGQFVAEDHYGQRVASRFRHVGAVIDCQHVVRPGERP